MPSAKCECRSAATMRCQATFNRRNNHSVIQDAPWPTVLLVVFPACPKASPTRLARRGTASASTSLCSPPMPPRSNSACSTPRASARPNGSRCPNTPTKFGTAICRMRGRARSMAIRVHGPYEPTAGHRFNPNKLLLDPYAKQIIGKLQWNPALFGYQMETGDDLTFDERDSAPFTSRAASSTRAFSWGRRRSARTSWENTIIYEAHVRGFTQRHPAVPEALRGTYAGLATAEITGYLSSLGVTPSNCCPSIPSSTTATCSTRA